MSEFTITALLLPAGMVLALYLILVRPQLRRLSEHQMFVASLKIGDHIVTGGGLLGHIIRCDETIVTISFGSGSTADALRVTVQGFAPLDWHPYGHG